MPQTIPRSRSFSPGPMTCLIKNALVSGISNAAREAAGTKLASVSPRAVE